MHSFSEFRGRAVCKPVVPVLQRREAPIGPSPCFSSPRPTGVSPFAFIRALAHLYERFGSPSNSVRSGPPSFGHIANPRRTRLQGQPGACQPREPNWLAQGSNQSSVKTLLAQKLELRSMRARQCLAPVPGSAKLHNTEHRNPILSFFHVQHILLFATLADRPLCHQQFSPPCT
jgi:hypothetical protein